VSCSRPGCTETATAQPVIELESREKPVRVVLIHVGFCRDHQTETVLDDVLSPEGFKKIAKFVRERGVRAPASKTARLAWRAVGPAELAMLEELTDIVAKDQSLAF
jgi:kynurenine formamidase